MGQSSPCFELTTAPNRRQLISTLLALPFAAHAQFRVEVAGVGANRIPLAIAAFRGESVARQAFTSIVAADLERSGQFTVDVLAESTLDESVRVDAASWRKQGADALLCGSVSLQADGRIQISVRLWDTVGNIDFGGLSLVITGSDARLASHRVADFVYKALTGVRGVFSTRIAYIVKDAGKYAIQIADADGFGTQTAFSSPEPLISPSWSPDGRFIAYVSFESRKPVVYVHELVSGKRRQVANFRGSNSAPSWSPDGKTLAVTLTQDGASQLYFLDTEGALLPRRVMRSESIDTESTFSADGRLVYFVSDRGGSPQIYKFSVEDARVERVTFEGSYNTSPKLSNDARWMAYVSRVQGEFKLMVMDLVSGKVTALTDTVADEHPCFAPNGRMIVYATQLEGEEVLMTTNLDGTYKTRLVASKGRIREPAWGPFEPAGAVDEAPDSKP